MIVAEFRALYSGFADNSDSQVGLYLDLFNTLYGEGAFGAVSDHMQGLFASHRLTKLKSSGSNTGELASRSIGDESYSYHKSSETGGELSSTGYGAELVDLLKSMSNSAVAS